MSSVSSVSGISSQTNSDNQIAIPTQTLSQQDFLNLLVTQMTSQDPLKPIDNQDMLSQMVQFSTLNANTTMQTALGQMQETQEMSEATGLMGKQVTLQVDKTTTAQGVVSGVDTSTTTPQIVVNGQTYTLDQVISVTNATTTTQ